jgi:hypothetical protein
MWLSLSRRLNGLDATMLARRQRAPGFIGVTLEAPEAQRLRIEKVEDVPSQLFLVDERHERLAVNRVERLHIKSRQFVGGVFGVGLGATGFGVGFLYGDENFAIRPTGACVNATHPLPRR